MSQGATGLVTAGSRASPQVNIVASIAQKLGVPCRVHTPEGALSPEVVRAKEKGAELVQHKAGYNNVIIARAREDAFARGWKEIPFGMECQEAVEQTRKQVRNLPLEVRRLVIPVGSGMSLCGIMWGLYDVGRECMPILAVQVGGDPKKRLEKFAPDFSEGLFSSGHRVEFIRAPEDYHEVSKITEFEGITLDPIYEAKAVRFLKPDDCLWVIGIRETSTKEYNATNKLSDAGVGTFQQACRTSIVAAANATTGIEEPAADRSVICNPA